MPHSSPSSKWASKGEGESDQPPVPVEASSVWSKWEDDEMVAQLKTGQQRVDDVRAHINQVALHLRRVKDNAEVIERQNALLHDQSEVIKELRDDVARLQNDNEYMKCEHAKLKRLRDEALAQRAEAEESEARHRQQLEGQADMVADVRQDLLALGAENAGLRRAASEMKSLEAEIAALRSAAAETEKQHRQELADLTRRMKDQEQRYEHEAELEAEKHRRAMKEQRFKILRTQQQQLLQQAGAEKAVVQAQLDEVMKECEKLRERTHRSEQQGSELAAELAAQQQRNAELQAVVTSLRASSESRKHGSYSPAESLAASPSSKRQELRVQQYEQHNRELLQQVEDLEGANAAHVIEERKLRATISALQEELDVARDEIQRLLGEQGVKTDHAPRHAADAEERYRDELCEASSRSDALAAKLASCEAALAAKEELLRSRTAERDRLRAVVTGSGDTSPHRALPPSGEAVAKMEATIATLKQQNATATRTNAQLEGEVAELKQRMQSIMSSNLTTGESRVVQILRSDLDKLKAERNSTVDGLNAEIETLNKRLVAVEQLWAAKVERVTADRQQLQERLEELLEKLEGQAD